MIISFTKSKYTRFENLKSKHHYILLSILRNVIYTRVNKRVIRKENLKKDYEKSLKKNPKGKLLDHNENNKNNNNNVIKADNNVQNAVIDIADTPDVAVWSKQIAEGIHIPADKVKEHSEPTSITIHAKSEDHQMQLPHRQDTDIKVIPDTKKGERIIDPANKEDVAETIEKGGSLTDRSELF
jgi:hypothetical protein